MRENFVDKVYDTYLSKDFSYGLDNLNPIREIDLDSVKSIDDKIAEVYAELNKRVKKVKKTISSITGEDEEVIIKSNAVPESNRGGTSNHRQNVIALMGSTGDRLIKVPGMDMEDDPIAIEVELMLLEKTVAAYFPNGPTVPGAGEGGEPPPPPKDPLEDIYSLNCEGKLTDASGKEVKKEDLKDKNYDILEDEDSEGLDGAEGESEKENKEGKIKEGPPVSDSDNLKDAVDEAIAQAAKDSADNAATIASCAQAELGILKMILAILKVVKMVRQILDVIPLVRQGIEIVTLAAQCWNNPTCIGLIIERVMGTVIAILMGIVAMLFQKIWEMLGLDCFTAETARIVDEIREALSSISGIVSEMNPTGIITDFKDIMNVAKDTMDSVQDNMAEFGNTIDELKKDGGKKALKSMVDSSLKAAGFPELSTEDFKNFMSNPISRQQILGKLEGIVPSNTIGQIKSMVETVLAVPDQVSDMMDMIKSFGKTLSAEKQIVASLGNLESF